MSNDPPPPPLWPFLFLCAAAAVWIDFGSLHRGQHADSLINILASLYAWTPFFWEQDRYGALVPLLAAPIKHPLGNLLFQDALTVWGGLAAPFLLARYLLRDAFYPLVAAAAGAAFLLLATPLYRFEFLVDTGYGVPFTLAFAALVLTIPDAAGRARWWRWPAALLLVVLAHWVFLATFLTLAPLVVLRRLFLPAKRGPDVEFRFGLVLAAAGLAGGLAARAFAGPWAEPTPFDSLPVWRWPVGWGRLAWRTWSVQAPHGCAWPALLVLAVAVPCLVPRLRRHAAAVARPAACLVGAGLASFLFMGTRRWTELNSYDYRYAMPSALLIQVAAFALALAPLRRSAGVRCRDAVPMAAVWLAAVVSYGWPSLQGVRDDLAGSLGEHSDAVLEARCTHVAGDYWFVWKTVYHANLLKYERGEPGVVWGVAFRGRPAWPRWRDMSAGEMRFGVLPHDLGQAELWLGDFGLTPVEVAEQSPDLLVLCRRPAGERTAGLGDAREPKNFTKGPLPSPARLP